MHWRTEAQPELGEFGAFVHIINYLYLRQEKLFKLLFFGGIIFWQEPPLSQPLPPDLSPAPFPRQELAR